MARPIIRKPEENGQLPEIPGSRLVGPVEGDFVEFVQTPGLTVKGGVFKLGFIPSHTIPAGVRDGTIDGATFRFAGLPHRHVEGPKKQVVVWLISNSPSGTPISNEFDNKNFTVVNFQSTDC